MPTYPLSSLLIVGGTGILLGVLLEKRRRRLRRRLPPPSQCPTTGVEFTGCLPVAERSIRWVFLSNHLMNLSFYNEHAMPGADGESRVADPRTYVQISYPVRLRAEAGFMRCFGLKDQATNVSRKVIGEQTVITTVHVGDERAHNICGVLVPFTEGKKPPTEGKVTKYVKVPMTSFDWLGAFDPPGACEVVDVLVFQTELTPPTFALPILQTHVDVLLEGALKHGEAFAAEVLDTIMWWESEEGVCYYLNDRAFARRPWVKNKDAPAIEQLLQQHPPGKLVEKHRVHLSHYDRKHDGKLLPALVANKDTGAPTADVAAATPGGGERSGAPPSLARNLSLERARTRGERAAGVEYTPPTPLAQRVQVSNFLIGFGSIIQTCSRASSDPKAVDAAPCRIKAAFGYVREWNFQASTAHICALGLRKVRKGEAGASINGVLFPAPSDMTQFDKRENGYQRVEVEPSLVELLSWHRLPPNARIYVYVPYAPAVVEKYGVDEATGLTRCSGPTPPDGLLPSETAGLSLQPPSVAFPILQTYIDVCLLGCLEHGEAFAEEFIRTTFLWTPYWLNERELARRPWLHQKMYVVIDALLKKGIPAYFGHRKHESEYAVYLLE